MSYRADDASQSPISNSDVAVHSHPSITESYSVASVTVATNAASMLPRQLDALAGQNRKLDEIVIVDNASNDGTTEMLRARYPHVTILRLPENQGVGGGYSAGLAYAALTKKHRWTWLLDDDSVPPADGLQNLLQGLQFTATTAEPAVLAPVCRDLATSASWPGMTWRNWRFVPTWGDPDQPLTFVDFVISSGTLIRSDAVQAVGLPRADFFMDFVDYEYCLRLRRHGYSIAVVQGSILEHEVGSVVPYSFLGRKGAWASHAPWREYYIARNETFTIWQDYPRFMTKVFVLYRLARHSVGILLFGRQRLACLRRQWQGFMDGRVGRLGIRVLPGK